MGLKWQPEDVVFHFADTVGDGSGVEDAIGDYSSAATPFMLKPAANELVHCERMVVTVRDSGSMDSGGYGNGAALTNGIKVRVMDDSGIVNDITGNQVIKTNEDWGKFCHDVSEVSRGAGDTYVSVRWTFAKTGKPLDVRGNAGEWLEILCNDDLTNLNGHFFHIQGYKENA